MSSGDMSSFVYVAGVPDDVGLSTFLWHIFSKKKYTDVEFDLLGSNGPVTFSAHKFVLSLWSPYFADKFYQDGNKVDGVNIVQLNDVNPETFETMLKFMYSFTPELDTHRTACELYKIAAQFEVTSLMNFCRDILNKIEVDPSNVFDILEVSQDMNNKSLEDRCLNLIQERTGEVIQAYGFSEISSSMLHIFLDMPKLSLPSELDLLMWLFAWGKNKYIEDPRYTSAREALEEFLPKMHFLSLTNSEFALLYKQQQISFSNDEVVVIFMNIALPGSMPMPNWYDESHPSRVYTG